MNPTRLSPLSEIVLSDSLARQFARQVALLVSCLIFPALTLAAELKRPNIILILADDLGWGDLASYNSESKIATPHLDRLAAAGVRFTNAHTPSAVCTPTRYGLLTGRYCWRTRLKSSVLDGFSPPLIEPGQSTIASWLRAKGYQTAAFGKWHLGLQWTRKDGSLETVDRLDQFRTGEGIDFGKTVTGGPTEVGFESFFGISGSLDMPPYCWIEDNRVIGDPSRMRTGVDQIYLSAAQGLTTSDFAVDQVLPTLKDRTVDWIAKHQKAKPDTPFFLYLALNSPHLPVTPSPAFVGKSKSGPYGDFIMETDDYVGAVIEAVRRAGALDNTLVIFTSDNGGLYHMWEPQEADDLAKYKPSARAMALNELGHRSNGKLRGTKADIYEGGHRVPLIVHWPAAIDAAVSDAGIELTDLFATVAELLGDKVGRTVAPDSFSFRETLVRGGNRKTTRPFLVHHSIGGVFALRQGDWKYIERRGSGGFSSPKGIIAAQGEAEGQLYNLRTDPLETKNVYLAQKEAVQKFQTLLAQVRASNSLRDLANTSVPPPSLANAKTLLPPTAAGIPGVIVNYVGAETGQFLGSPSLAVLPNGAYVVSHDYFGKASTERLTSIFTSSDRGNTWQHLTDIDGQWWSGLFVHHDTLYLMGNREWLGDVVIRRSNDGGRTWTEPSNGKSGLLMQGRFHTSAVPMVVHQGRLWRAMEKVNFSGPGGHWQTEAFIMSAPVDSNLMNAESWTATATLDSPAGYNNWREGNAVAAASGEMIDLIRVHVDSDKAAIIHLGKDGKTLTYDPSRDLIDFPGGASKYTVRYDATSGLYWSLVNKQKNPPASRNLLALVSSPDLRHWETRATLLHHKDRSGHAFQYVDWLVDGNDVIAVIRTAWDGAHNAHDSNYVTFHRFPNFRVQPTAN